MTAAVVPVDQPTGDHWEAVAAPLRAYNERHGPPMRARPLAVLLRDEAGVVVGGLWAETLYDWMFVEALTVPETLRGQGLGARLMAEAEAIARDRDCVGAWLDTFAFQSPGFYERLGYEAFGQLDDHPAGSARIFMRKQL
ncbi:GNAT family N-acetyltransferase [Caulobacter mirabilis]|uniref:GNAT family N-acetyltransferase n=1 Tax=Caulobacter mirabilis TaxID=69666 RepID=A0A2D2AYN2_9CAUL|nr:GNAT family N-acetyltransferase [Caulobacter mirabilis]ATQ43103.1 GNAT family N-acetyltransferase [Caulobacter mirabilis]